METKTVVNQETGEETNAPLIVVKKDFYVGKFTGRREHQTNSVYWLLVWLLKLAGITETTPLAAHKVATDAISQLGDAPIDSEVNWGKVKKEGGQTASATDSYSFQAAEATRWARKAQELYKAQKSSGITIRSVELAKEDVTWFEAQNSQFSAQLEKTGFKPVYKETPKE